MSAPDEIASILDQWLQLTQAEGAAIQKSNWPEVKRIQSRKASLRPPLAEAARQCAANPGSPATRLFHTRAARIHSLLTHNGAVLAAQLQQARARQETINQARRNLRGIGRLYARPLSSSAWTSYS